MSARATRRAERCDLLAWRLAAAIARETPPGLGAWAPAWTLVEDASRAYLGALREYEAGRGSKDAVVQCAEGVRAAWRRAAMRWKTMGDQVA